MSVFKKLFTTHCNWTNSNAKLRCYVLACKMLSSEKADLTSTITATFSCVIHIQFATLHVQSTLGAFVHWRGFAFWLKLNVCEPVRDQEKHLRIEIVDEKEFARLYWTVMMISLKEQNHSCNIVSSYRRPRLHPKKYYFTSFQDIAVQRFHWLDKIRSR